MSNVNVNNMDVKQLRNEVQMLRDELAIMQRKYEDILYNLDDNNFSSRLVQEKDNMKTQISITAEGIETKVSQDEFESKMKQTAQLISTKVSNEELKAYSTTLQTAELITSTVSDYQTKADADDAYDELYSMIEQTAGSITSTVSKSINTYFESDTMPNSNASDTQKTMLCLHDGTYYYYNETGRKWEEYPYGGLQTVFRQTANEFELVGNVKITQIAQVAKDLYLGSENDYSDKRIILSNTARISSFTYGLAGAGLNLSANGIKFSGLAYTNENEPDIFANDKRLATQAWVQSKFTSGEAGGTAVAVFG